MLTLIKIVLKDLKVINYIMGQSHYTNLKRQAEKIVAWK
jgi:hypothetical protein